MKHFRMLEIPGISYNRQGYIYFASMMYAELPPEDQEELDDHCRRVGGVYWKALRDLMCTQKPITRVIREHHIGSETTLYRLRRTYYEKFPW